MQNPYMKWIMLIAGLGLFVVDLTELSPRIDTTTLLLLLVAFLPWLLPMLKSIEFPGGLKLEFEEFEDTEQRALEVDLLDEPGKSVESQEYGFQLVANEDPNLALAGLRIEIEKRLVSLADRAGISRNYAGVRHLLRILQNKELLEKGQIGVLGDLIGLLNSAVHGADVDKKAASWAIEIGPRLLSGLDTRISEISKPQ